MVASDIYSVLRKKSVDTLDPCGVGDYLVTLARGRPAKTCTRTAKRFSDYLRSATTCGPCLERPLLHFAAGSFLLSGVTHRALHEGERRGLRRFRSVDEGVDLRHNSSFSRTDPYGTGGSPANVEDRGNLGSTVYLSVGRK